MSGLRIIAGRFRGRVVASPVDPGSRPLLARIRRSLGDRLQPELEGAGVLDLFAGSGIVGLELLSRGAAAVTFVDSSPRAVESIRATLATFHVERPAGWAVAGDALRPDRWVDPGLPGSPWSLVFVGTPYRLAATPEGRHRLVAALGALRCQGAVRPGATLVLQFEPDAPVDLASAGWTAMDAGGTISGRTGLSRWRAQPP